MPSLDLNKLVPAGFTLIGVLIGYAVSFLTLQEKKANDYADHVKLFSDAILGTAQALDSSRTHGTIDSRKQVLFLVSLFEIPNATKDNTERLNEKGTAITIGGSVASNDAEDELLPVYQADRDYTDILSANQGAALVIRNAIDRQKRRTPKETSDTTPESISYSGAGNVAPVAPTGWLYLGKSDLGANGNPTKLFDATITSNEIPPAGSTVTLAEKANFRQSAPSGPQHRLGSIIGLLQPGSKVKVISTQPFPFTPSADTIWANVSEAL